MAHTEQRDFIQRVKAAFPQAFTNVDVLEVGSLNINGTVRDFFRNTDKAKVYLGIDLIEGKDVDLVCPGHKLSEANETYDTVISTECFEHDKHWLLTFLNMHRMCKTGGLVIFTCASDGRHEHGTTRTSPQDSPATNDYYMNLNQQHFMDAFKMDAMFENYNFEYNPVTCDLYFWGIKKEVEHNFY